MQTKIIVNDKGDRLTTIELKHLAPYLPYGLKVYGEYESLDGITKNMVFDLNMTNLFDVLSNKYKPLLIPLKEDYIAEYDLEETFCNSRLRLAAITRAGSANYKQVVYMISRHFDVFGLIDAGIALNKNNLKK